MPSKERNVNILFSAYVMTAGVAYMHFGFRRLQQLTMQTNSM